MRELNTVDLFCGAGGASTGLEIALSRLKMCHKGLAINHWAVAVDTMKRNHPDIDTKRMSIEEAVPADLVPEGVVDLLWASPSCTHHSRAKGGKPRSNQLRAQPELVLTWLDQLFVRRVIIENVPEFVEWGPLNKDGKTIKRLKGACFQAWVKAIEARNYAVEWRIVNCADYGDATTRRRFFLKAIRRGCGKIVWPEPTHAENPEPDFFETKKPWRGIRECLDLADTGKSIFDRKKPLAKNTIRRIAVGLKKYCGLDFQMDMLGADGADESRLRSIDKPMVTQHAGGNRVAIVRPFIARLRNNETAQGIDEPLSTISCSGAHHMLCTPFVFTQQNNNAPRSIEEPIRAQTCVRKDYLCTPLILGQQGGAECRPVKEPCPTIATAGAIRMITPLVVDYQKNGKAVPVDSPIGAQTTHDRDSLVTPILMDMSHPGDTNDERRVTSAGEPLKTVTTRNNHAVVTPFVFDNANSGVQIGGGPLNTITTKDNHMVAFPVLEDGRVIDIRIRMLKPEELAAAHSFPSDYILTGNRGEQLKQIGNSVPVMTAAAMCEADLREM